jgi:hypothetical protein
MAQATPEEIELHNLILIGDDLAFAKLCDKYLEPTIKKVRDFNWQIHLKDETLIPEIVIDSFYKYFYNPQKFNPEKQTLEKFFVLDAEGDLKNAWAKQKRHQKKFQIVQNEVELDEQFGKSEIGKLKNLNTPNQILINNEARKILESELKRLFANEKDIEIANLILERERETSVYAEVLQITHLEIEKQQQQVKRNKDRIKKVLERKLKGKQY